MMKLVYIDGIHSLCAWGTGVAAYACIEAHGRFIRNTSPKLLSTGS